MSVTRAYVAPAVTRRAVGPAGTGTTLHCIGDVHAGPIPAWRLDALASDFARTMLRAPLAHVQLGDGTDGFTAGDYPLQATIYQRFKARLPARTYEAIGNHDRQNQTVEQWEARVGHDADQTVDFPELRLIVLGSDDTVSADMLSATTLAFLDAALAGTTKPCLIACHYPLWDTVGGDPALEYVSTQAAFYVRGPSGASGSSAEVLAVLAAHPNVKAWIAGHTHSRLTVPGLVMPMLAGRVRFASINTSCIWYCGLDHNSQVGGPLDPVNSLFVTWLGDRIEVTFRSHNGGGHLAPNGNPVMTVAGL